VAGITALAFGVVVRRAIRPGANTALAGLMTAVVGALGILVFWSGLPIVLAGAALLLAWEIRRRGARVPAAITVVVAVLTVAGTGLAVVTDDEPSPPRAAPPPAPTSVPVEATEYGYAMPTQFAGGAVTFEIENTGREMHEFGLVRLADGVSLDDLLAAFQQGEPPASVAEDASGIPAVGPGQDVRVTRELDPGSYAFVCYLPSPEGRPHATLGMATAFTVESGNRAALPEADASIVATDDGLEVPELRAGVQVIELRNEGPGSHEFWLVAFESGKSDRDVEAWLGNGQKGPIPATFLGGVKSIPAGTSIFLEVTLERGTTYTVADYSAGFAEEITVP
jgi:hypothetical protein